MGLIEWLRMPGDVVFIVFGATPLAICMRAMRPGEGGENRISPTLLTLCPPLPDRREFLQVAIVRRA